MSSDNSNSNKIISNNKNTCILHLLYNSNCQTVFITMPKWYVVLFSKPVVV